MNMLGMMHICLLVMIQWISLATVVLNVVASTLAQNEPQLQGQLVSASKSGLQDTMLIITGIISFLAATFPLCLQLRLSCQSSQHSSFASTTKKILIGELATGVVMVAFWTAVVSVVLTQFHVSSNCQLEVLKGVSACKMMDMAITSGLGVIVGWVILLIIASINLAKLPIMTTPEFILETNPYLTSYYASGEDKRVSLSADTASAPPYTPPSPQLPPPSFSSIVAPTRNSYSLPSSTDYPADIKYPIYSIDSLPTIQSGSSKFDLSFLH
ncbi:hypothetical protein BCR42DRAFT_390205 [Absidia repens]|uniref:MARVEL domain-containing protein n=1 Tax=Absidia repens TaxID=90262 RepID=A0A1X2INE4_9FUNG|nr:hypothetical protein BCR42DRAFT_390205 [Absidia repens]